MSGVVSKKIQDKINSNQLRQYTQCTGVILDYDQLSNTATIRYPNPHGDGYLYREHARVSNSLGGITSDAIQPGNKCSITFTNSNIMSPVVTGIINSNYLDKTNTDQGAYLVDRTLLGVEKQYEECLSSTWFDEQNENTSKYITDFNNYTETDTALNTYNIINGLDKYKNSESGMTNLSQKTNIKQTDNGDIEIFVSNTVGVRISSKDHKIYFYGKGIYLNDKELTLNTDVVYEIINSSISQGDNSDSDTIIAEFEKNIELINLDVEELKACIKYLKQITGFTSKYKTLESKISKYEKIRDSYQPGVTTVNEVIIMNNDILALQPIFAKELKDAKIVVNKNASLTN